MNIDKGSFLVLTATLAAGGAGGYVASEKNVLPHIDESRNAKTAPLAPAKPEPPPVADAGPAPVAVVVDAGPACSDEVGVPGNCPPPGFPVAEGGCGSFAATRCAEFKNAMKPRVAQAAVECLNKLSPQERCDKDRVNLCGHVALANACAPPSASGGEKDEGLTLCQGIASACNAPHSPPSIRECQQTMSGLNDTGRKLMTQCMQKHCVDRSILGCEAVPAR